MKLSIEYLRRAIPASMAGIALLFLGCQVRPSVRKVQEDRGQPEQFYLAEQYYEEGESDRALEYYDAYIKWTPNGENVPLALHRMGDIYFERGEYKKSLGTFERIIDEYPDYKGLSLVEFQKVHAHYLLGDYSLSISEGLKWLEKYPWNKQEPQMKVLIGDNFKELGSLPKAFDWWTKAERIYEPDSVQRNVLGVKIESVIEESDAEDLERIVDYAVDSRYAPFIYYRLATLYSQDNKTEKAEKAAMSLIDSTSDPDWVAKGYRILEGIRKGTLTRAGAIGCLLPLSGPFKIYGEEVLNGIQLGMGLFGESRGVVNPELIIRDTRGDPDEAVRGLRELVEEEKVMAVIGPLSSRVAEPVAQEAEKLGVPLITLTQKKDITSQGEMIFRNFMTPAKEVEKLLSLATSELGLRRFAILYPENSYGKHLMSLFWDRLVELGGTVTAVESYPENETDFADQIKKMTGLYYPRPPSAEDDKESKKGKEGEDSEEPEPIIDFDAIFIPDNYQNVAMIAAHLAYHDVKDVQLIGTSLWNSPQILEMGEDYLQGAFFTTGYSELSDRPGAREFAEDYRKNFEKTPGILAASGYDTVRFLDEIMLKGNINSRNDLQMEILLSRGFEGVTGTIFFNETGEVQKEPQVLQIRGKKMVLFHK